MIFLKNISLPSYFAKYITIGNERSIKAKRNILFSFFIKGLNILISLLLVPLTINYVDKTQYGIWLTLSSIIAWFGFFDIGFGNGLRNKFAEAIASGKHKLARIYVSTTYAILSILIGVVLILFLCVNPFLNWANILNTSQSMAPQLSLLALIVFVFFCIQFILQLVTIVLTANQQPAKSALFNLFGNFFTLVIIYVLTKTSNGNLIYLGITLSLTPVLVLLGSSIWFYNRDYKIYSPNFNFVKFRFAKQLMNLGLKFFVIQVAAIVLFQSNNLIIAHLFGPQEVTVYNIVYKYFSVITMISTIVMTPFWTAFTDSWYKKDINWIKNIVKKLQKFWLLLCVISILMMFASNFIYEVWLNGKIQVSFIVSVFMMINVMIITWNMIYVQFLNGIGKIQLQLYSGIFGTVLIIPLTIILAKYFGVVGILIASCILGLINTTWTYLQYNKIINNNARGIWNK